MGIVINKKCGKQTGFLRGGKMYKLENEKPHFIPYDICKVVDTDFLVIVTEVNCNTCQSADQHQWSYAVTSIIPGQVSKSAWYSQEELQQVNNIFSIIANKSMHPFGNKTYTFDLKNERRK